MFGSSAIAGPHQVIVEDQESQSRARRLGEEGRFRR